MLATARYLVAIHGHLTVWKPGENKLFIRVEKKSFNYEKETISQRTIN